MASVHSATFDGTDYVQRDSDKIADQVGRRVFYGKDSWGSARPEVCEFVRT